MEQVGREPGILRWRCVYGCVWLGRPTIHKLKTEYQRFKRISVGLTGFSGIKNAYRKCFFACGFGGVTGRDGNVKCRDACLILKETRAFNGLITKK